MNIRTEKLNIIHQILQLEDELMLQTVKDLLALGCNQADNETDIWDELSESQKASIELSIKQLENDEGVSHEQVQAEMRKMLTK
jgi:NRPS condensation-like uncharacterized protein